jgi:hypothetical protein
MLVCLLACWLAWLPALSRSHCLTHENLPAVFRCVCKILCFGIEILWSIFVWQAQSCFCGIVVLFFLLFICSGWVLLLFLLFIYITVYLCSYFTTLKHKYFVSLWHAELTASVLLGSILEVWSTSFVCMLTHMYFSCSLICWCCHEKLSQSVILIVVKIVKIFFQWICY